MIMDKEKPDASSRFQDTLPVSSDELMRRLDKWGILYNCFKHDPVNTVEESKRIQGEYSSKDGGGGHIKNLYLRDHKKRNVLLVADQDCKIDLKNIKETLGTGRLSFGSPIRLMENLGVRPGAVTPFAMVTGVQNKVELCIDTTLLSFENIYAHPLVNDLTLELPVKQLLVFLEKISVPVKWVDVS